MLFAKGEKIMNILIIENGFDLAHGLPTKYGDFLDFCERARRIYTYLGEREGFIRQLSLFHRL